MPPVYLLQRIGDLADRGLGPGRIDSQCQQIVAKPGLIRPAAGRASGRGRTRQLGQGGVDDGLIPICPQLFQFGQLLGSHAAVLDLEYLDLLILFDLVLVHPDDGLDTGIDTGLGARGGLLDTQLGNTFADGLRHTAVLGDLGDVGTRPLRELIGQPFHVIRTRPRVDRPGGARLLLQHELGVAGDAGREVGG